MAAGTKINGKVKNGDRQVSRYLFFLSMINETHGERRTNKRSSEMLFGAERREEENDAAGADIKPFRYRTKTKENTEE